MNTDYQKTMSILLHKESLNGMILVIGQQRYILIIQSY
jgi:hypothetical protein